MPRSNSRPTLKLPVKPDAASPADTGRFPTRKPVRAGAKTPKPSVAQYAAMRARTAIAETSRPPVRENVAVPVGKVSVRERPSPAPVTPAVRAPEPPAPRVYPKRGIARSTGARALPPARPREEPDLPRPNINRRETAPRPTPPAPRLPALREVPAAAPAAQAEPARRPLQEPPRLSKRISMQYQCSRREADEWIENGWVRVDGVVVTTLGVRVAPQAKIEVRDEARQHKTEHVTILFNKPLGSPAGAIGETSESPLPLIHAANRWTEDDSRLSFKATHLRGLALAGKLDAEATGMLVFTQEGSVARRITGDDTRLEKEYQVRVDGELTPEGLQRLNYGLTLDDIKLKRAQVSWQNEQQLRFVLHETRKCQIQRMCELVGLRVTSIKRIRIGSVSLGKLPAGQWRYLRENERF